MPEVPTVTITIGTAAEAAKYDPNETVTISVSSVEPLEYDEGARFHLHGYRIAELPAGTRLWRVGERHEWICVSPETAPQLLTPAGLAPLEEVHFEPVSAPAAEMEACDAA